MAQHLLELERQRLQLEDSVAKLRKAIRHWQTWEAEYEELREETSALKEDHKTKDLVHCSLLCFSCYVHES